jgi:hypothetical protein
MNTLIPILALIVVTNFEVLAGDGLTATSSVQPSQKLTLGSSTSGLWINTNIVSGVTKNSTNNQPITLLLPTGLHIVMNEHL